MTDRINRRIVLEAHPEGTFRTTDLRYTEDPVAPLAEGHALIGVDVLSIDAFIRTVMDPGAYHRSLALGSTVTALGVGTVLESTVDTLAPGDQVFGPLGAQTFMAAPAGMFRKLDVSEVPASAYLGAIGMTTGLTAFFGMSEVAQIQPGDTVVVSGAAGAVGSLAGQIARLLGAGQVIGIAGGPAKCAFLVDELGFTAAIDYKNDDVAARLTELAPDGVNVMFDNVGGEILDTVLFQIARGARVVICGAISQYEQMDAVRGPSNYLKLAERRARMEGFDVTTFAAQFAEGEATMKAWLVAGNLVMREHRMHGVEQFPEALHTLLTGGHTGKLLLAIS